MLDLWQGENCDQPFDTSVNVDERMVYQEREGTIVASIQEGQKKKRSQDGNKVPAKFPQQFLVVDDIPLTRGRAIGQVKPCLFFLCDGERRGKRLKREHMRWGDSLYDQEMDIGQSQYGGWTVVGSPLNGRMSIDHLSSTESVNTFFTKMKLR